MDSNIFNAVKAFVASALIDRKTTIDQVISISNGMSESINSVINALRCNFPTMTGMGVLPVIPILHAKTGDTLKGTCVIGREFKRTSDLICVMVDDHQGEWAFDYYFNYGRRDDSPIYDQNTLSDLEKKAAYLVYLDMTAVIFVAAANGMLDEIEAVLKELIYDDQQIEEVLGRWRDPNSTTAREIDQARKAASLAVQTFQSVMATAGARMSDGGGSVANGG